MHAAVPVGWVEAARLPEVVEHSARAVHNWCPYTALVEAGRVHDRAEHTLKEESTENTAQGIDIVIYPVL